MEDKSKNKLPTLIKLTFIFSILGVIIVIAGPQFEDFYIFQNPLLLLILIILILWTILISGALTHASRKLEPKALSWMVTVLLGLGSFFIFMGVVSLTFRNIGSNGKGYIVLFGGFLVCFISLCFNLMLRGSLDKK